MNILFVMEVFTFLYYANEESDDLIGGSSKTVEHVIKISKFSAPNIEFLAFWLAKKLRIWANIRSFTSYGR